MKRNEKKELEIYNMESKEEFRKRFILEKVFFLWKKLCVLGSTRMLRGKEEM